MINKNGSFEQSDENNEIDFIDDNSSMVDWSERYNFYSSSFKVGTYELKYNFIEAPLGALTKDFKIFEEIPGVEEYPVRDLIQRELDKGRARKMYESYLKGSSVKFYAPLIVALVPFRDRKLLSRFREEEISMEDIRSKFAQSNLNFESFGGVVEARQANVKKNGKMAWDRSKVHAVVIDGQHRLYSFIQYAQNQEENYGNMAVPMVLLDLRKFKSNEKDYDVKEVVRKIFVSLNQTPEAIELSRLILLNDHSFSAIFAQEVVENNSEEDLCREAVDVICKDGKHGPHFLTGVTTIYYIIEDVFFNGQNIDFIDTALIRNQKKFKKFINRTCDIFSYDDYFKSQIQINAIDPDSRFTPADALKKLPAFSTSVKADESGEEDGDGELGESVYILPSEHFKFARKLFSREFKKIFVKCYKGLRAFKPYWDVYNENGLGDKDSLCSRYLRSTQSMRNRMEDDFKRSFNQEVMLKLRRLEELNFEIARSVVGQKAIFLVYLHRYWHGDGSVDQKVDRFLVGMNSVIDKCSSQGKFFFDKDFRVGKTQLWENVALINGALDNSSNSYKRIYSVLALLLLADDERYREEVKGILDKKGNVVDELEALASNKNFTVYFNLLIKAREKSIRLTSPELDKEQVLTAAKKELSRKLKDLLELVL